MARGRGYPVEAFAGWRMLLNPALASLPGLALIAILFGGVRSGVFTATERSCVATVYALFVTVLVYRSMSWRHFLRATAAAVRTTAMVLLVIGSATAFGWLLAWCRVPAAITEAMQGVSDSPVGALLIINLALLALGTFMDMSPLIVITKSIFLPVAQAFGVDPVPFGVILVLGLGVGLCTPRVGSVLLVGCAVAKIPIGQTLRTIWPFYGAMLAALMLVTYVPALSLWLPSLMR